MHGEPSGGWQRLNENTRTNTKLAEKMLANEKEFISVEIVELVFDLNPKAKNQNFFTSSSKHAKKDNQPEIRSSSAKCYLICQSCFSIKHACSKLVLVKS